MALRFGGRFNRDNREACQVVYDIYILQQKFLLSCILDIHSQDERIPNYDI